MKFFFIFEYLVRQWECWEVAAANFEEACGKFGRLRDEGEDGEIVDGCDLIQVEDEYGSPYDPQKADDLAWPVKLEVSVGRDPIH